MTVPVRCGGQGVLLQGLSPDWCHSVGRPLTVAGAFEVGM